MTLGTKVGARRWPYASAHPDCWQQPWAGIVLDQADPRAWAGTIAFPFPEANICPLMVACHVTTLLDDKIPVLWDFGDHARVYWEDAKHLRSYEEDVAAWQAARELERR